MVYGTDDAWGCYSSESKCCPGYPNQIEGIDRSHSKGPADIWNLHLLPTRRIKGFLGDDGGTDGSGLGY